MPDMNTPTTWHRLSYDWVWLPDPKVEYRIRKAVYTYFMFCNGAHLETTRNLRDAKHYAEAHWKEVNRVAEEPTA